MRDEQMPTREVRFSRGYEETGEGAEHTGTGAARMAMRDVEISRRRSDRQLARWGMERQLIVMVTIESTEVNGAEVKINVAVPALLILRLVNMALPLELVVTVVVPLRTPPPVPVLIAAVTEMPL